MRVMWTPSTQEHELAKKHEERLRLSKMDIEHRRVEEARIQKEKDAHKKHETVHAVRRQRNRLEEFLVLDHPSKIVDIQ